MLLFLLSGVLLLRFAERQLFALLFQLPPRLTRFEPLSDAYPYPEFSSSLIPRILTLQFRQRCNKRLPERKAIRKTYKLKPATYTHGQFLFGNIPHVIFREPSD